ncbi:hypothetical protein NHQ30_003572 [Ciborinia camelliae]|nr:hypothetical protein NHQ30_003572 [Ciborinia camelliae]
MSKIQQRVATWSSIALRIATFIFLRIIPGHPFPPIIYTLFALYVPSLIASHATKAPSTVVEDDIDIITTDTEREDQPSGAETVVVEEKSSRPIRTILTGSPDPVSYLLSILTFLINAGLVLATIDLVYRAKVFYPSTELSFARMGYIGPTEANLLVREPDLSKLPISVTYELATDSWANMFGKPQLAGTIKSLSEDTDFTQALKFSLPNNPEKTYRWTTSNNHTGFFTTPPKPGGLPQSGSFTFFTSSCIKPRFPYSPFDHALEIPGLRHMADVIKTIPGGAQFMLFLGDFIYIDVPKRFGVTKEDYRREYRQVYSSPDWPAVGTNLSEGKSKIKDPTLSDCSPDYWSSGRGSQFGHVLSVLPIPSADHDAGQVYKAAADPWQHYQMAVNPPRARQSETYNGLRDNATYFEFTHGPASFFLMDTRTYRDSSSDLPANSTGKSMLGAQQLADFLDFLKKPEPKGVKWKIVTSSVPFTKNWRVNSMDTWAGYLNERQVILEAMWDVGLGGHGVVIISGDRHEFAATAFPPPLNGRWPVSATVNEFSTSPLSQFYLPIPTYWQDDDADIKIKYIPLGNSKLGAITIENTDSDQSVLNFRLYVDGHEAWSSILLSPPIISGG